MVEADVGNPADPGRHHVGGVEPAAQADLHASDARTSIPKVHEPHHGEHLKGGDVAVLIFPVQAAHQGLELLDLVGELLLGDWADAGDGDALAHGMEVRGGIHTGAQPGGFEHRRHHRDGAALPFGAGDVNHRDGKVRVTNKRQERLDALQVELSEEYRMGRTLEIGEPENEVQGLHIIQGGRPPASGGAHYISTLLDQRSGLPSPSLGLLMHPCRSQRARSVR